MVAPIRYLSRRQQEQKIGILQSTEEEKVLEVIGRVGIGTTIFDAEYNLDVRGDANISGILSVGQIISDAGNTFSDLTITGIATFQSDVIIGGGLTVTGVSTFASDLDINASVDISNNLTVDGLSDLDELNVSGLSTFASDLDINASVDISNNLTVDGLSDLDELNVSGLSTFASLIDANNGIDASSVKVEDLTENRVVIAGVGGELEDDANFTFDGSQLVVGAALNVTGVSTFQGNVNLGGELHGPELFIIDPAAVGDNTGAVRIKGDLYVDGTEFIVNSTTIELADYRVGIATTLGTNLLLDGAGISIGDTNIEKTFTYNNTTNTLESSIGLGVTVGGEFKTGSDSVLNRTTLGPTVVNSSLTSVGTLIGLDVNGQTELDDLNVSGGLNVSGIATITTIDATNATIDNLTFTSGTAITSVDTDLTTVSGSDDTLASAKAIKTYVDSQVTAQDLDFAGDSGTGAVDLDSEVLTIQGTTNEIETVGLGNTLTIGLPDNVSITDSLTVGSATTISSSGIVAGIITGTLDNTLTLATSGNGISGSTTYNNSSPSTFTVTSNATSANTADTIVYRDSSGNFSAGTITADLTGVASTATKLETVRDFSVSGDVATSSGVSFDGTANVDLAVTLSNTFSANTSGIITSTGGFVGDITGDLTGVASTATQLETARDFSITGSFVTASAVSFDGTG